MAVTKLALGNLQKQASKIVDVSNPKYPMAAIGDTVRSRVPDDDRARSDERNILPLLPLTCINWEQNKVY